jgi:hypothetical protein
MPNHAKPYLPRYLHPAKANMRNNQQPSTNNPTNYNISMSSTAHASAHRQRTLKPAQTPHEITRSKRVLEPDSLPYPAAKKPKTFEFPKSQTTKQKPPPSHQQPTQHPHSVFIQPISNLIYTNPLTNVERWRLRGWTWPEAVFRVGHHEDLVEVESSRGTKGGWGI